MRGASAVAVLLSLPVLARASEPQPAGTLGICTDAGVCARGGAVVPLGDRAPAVRGSVSVGLLLFPAGDVAGRGDVTVGLQGGGVNLWPLCELVVAVQGGGGGSVPVSLGGACGVGIATPPVGRSWRGFVELRSSVLVSDGAVSLAPSLVVGFRGSRSDRAEPPAADQTPEPAGPRADDVLVTSTTDAVYQTRSWEMTPESYREDLEAVRAALAAGLTPSEIMERSADAAGPGGLGAVLP